jgi:hypothetical protein
MLEKLEKQVLLFIKIDAFNLSFYNLHFFTTALKVEGVQQTCISRCVGCLAHLHGISHGCQCQRSLYKLKEVFDELKQFC